jgi:hypothetical protein
MVNGKPGDHPYTDILAHGMDLGEPEIAARLRAVDKIADLGVQHLLSDLVEYLFPPAPGLPDDYVREKVAHASGYLGEAVRQTLWQIVGTDRKDAYRDG